MILLPTKFDLMATFIKCTNYYYYYYYLSLLHFYTNIVFTGKILPKRKIKNKKFGSHDQIDFGGFQSPKAREKIVESAIFLYLVFNM
jgi:hypothetical protein